MKKLAFLLLISTQAYSASPSSCEGCHGKDGRSPPAKHIPSLAGQNKDYLINQLKNFKSGKREDPTMNGVVSGLSDSDIEELAKFFSDKTCK